MQGTVRKGSGLCAHRVDQGSTAAAMGCDGGGSGSGLLLGRRHRWVKARCAVESRAWERQGQGTGSEMAHDKEAGHGRAQSRGGIGGNMVGNENEAPSPSPTFPFFYRAVG